jgi:hypothetical protein
VAGRSLLSEPDSPKVHWTGRYSFIMHTSHKLTHKKKPEKQGESSAVYTCRESESFARAFVHAQRTSSPLRFVVVVVVCIIPHWIPLSPPPTLAAKSSRCSYGGGRDSSSSVGGVPSSTPPTGLSPDCCCELMDATLFCAGEVSVPDDDDGAGRGEL